MKKLKVLVLCGGKSAERQVSLVSAKLVVENLDRARFAPELVFIDPKGGWRRAKEKLLSGKVEVREKNIAPGSKALTAGGYFANGVPPDVVFPVLHGPMGEDGTLQGLLDLLAIPYVGCGVAGSALGMDKELSKRLAAAQAIPILPFVALNDPALAPGAAERLGFPVFVKPARLGSSVGVSKVKTAAELRGAVKAALRYDDKLVIEKGISAREIECALLGDPGTLSPGDTLALKASVVGEIVPNADFYSYRSKYLDPEGARLNIPAEIPAAAAERVRELSMKAFRALDGYGMARADFLMDKKSGEIYFNEVNTIPGFTPASMYPLLWKASGVPTPELLTRLIELALRRHRSRSKLKTTP